MKIVVVILPLLISAHFIDASSSIQNSENIELAIENGGIRGTVQLANKPGGVRSGGGLYGRSSRITVQASSTDSILVVLSGNTTDQINSDEFALLNQFDRKFQPGILPVQIGQTVRITNSDPVYHNVFSLTSPHKFDVGRRPKGEHYDVEFEKPGLVDVFCDIHSNMHAIIFVMPENTIKWKKIKNGDSFEFNNLPNGTYSLLFYAMGYSQAEQTVNVSTDEILNVGTLTLNP